VLLVGWQLLELPQAVWLSWVIELLSEQPLEPLRPQPAQQLSRAEGSSDPWPLVRPLRTVQFALPVMNSDEGFSPVAEVTR
jgi:hypothetical protein